MSPIAFALFAILYFALGFCVVTGVALVGTHEGEKVRPVGAWLIVLFWPVFLVAFLLIIMAIAFWELVTS